MAKNRPTGPIQPTDDLPEALKTIDPTNLVGDEEKNPENDDGHLPVDPALDPFAGREFDVIGQEDEGPGDGGITDLLGDQIGDLTDRTPGVDVGSPFDDGSGQPDPGTTGGPDPSHGKNGPEEPPEGKYGDGMISGGLPTWDQVVAQSPEVEVASDFLLAAFTPITLPAAIAGSVVGNTINAIKGVADLVAEPDEDAEEKAKKEAEEKAKKEAEEKAKKEAEEKAKKGGDQVDPDYISPEERARAGDLLGAASPGVDMDQARKGGAKDGGDIDDPPEGNEPIGTGGTMPNVKDQYLGGDRLEPEFGGGRDTSGGREGLPGSDDMDPPRNEDGGIPGSPGKTERDTTRDFKSPPEEQAAPKETSVDPETAAKGAKGQPELEMVGGTRYDKPDFELRTPSPKVTGSSGPVDPKSVTAAAPAPFEPISIDPASGSIESPIEVISARGRSTDSADEARSEDQDYTVQTHDEARWRVPISHAENQTIFEHRPDLRASNQEDEPAHRPATDVVFEDNRPDLPGPMKDLPPLENADGSVNTGDATADSGEGSVGSGDATAEDPDEAEHAQTSASIVPPRWRQEPEYVEYEGALQDQGGLTSSAEQDPEPNSTYTTDVVFEDRRPELERVDLGGSDEPEPEIHTDDAELEELGG